MHPLPGGPCEKIVQPPTLCKGDGHLSRALLIALHEIGLRHGDRAGLVILRAAHG